MPWDDTQPFEGELRPRPRPRHVALTMRESMVLQWVARGMTNKEIAAYLQVSPHTVRDHVTNILRKCGVSSREALISQLANALLVNEELLF